jgi:hypothetical protein
VTIKVDHKLKSLSLQRKECEGCQKSKKQCAFIIYSKSKYMQECPCKECLVKTTCSTYCNERSLLYHISIDEDAEWRKQKINGIKNEPL